jgi:Zn-dependent peptidase ImmA (M78 family)
VTKRFGSADQLIEELGITEPDEIDVEAIAQYCGATIVYDPLKGCEARILGTDTKAIITVNSDSPRTRQRFSGGHELGHWMRDRGKAAFACTESIFQSEWQTNNAEAKANEFAAELLMPTKVFGGHARSREMTFATVKDLANQFATSITATAIRFVTVGSYPAIVIFSRDGRRRWFARGPDVPESIWPLEEPTAYSVAGDIFRGKAARTPNEIRGDSWLSYREARHHFVVEDSITLMRGTVLTLIWWKDEGQLVEMEGDDD